MFYNTLHSAGKIILLPWAYTVEPAPYYTELNSVALMGIDAMLADDGEWKVSFYWRYYIIVCKSL